MATTLNAKTIKTIKTQIAKALDFDIDGLKVSNTGDVAFKVKAAKSETSSSDTKPTTASGLGFVYGERADLKEKWASEYKKHEGLLATHFGRIITHKDIKIMAIGIEGGKIRVRKEDGKNAKLSKSAFIKSFEASTPVRAGVLSDNTPKNESSTTKAAQAADKYQVLSGQQPTRVALNADKKKELKAKFNAKAAKLDNALSFYTPIALGDGEIGRIIGLVESNSKYRVYNANTGKTVRIACEKFA